VESGSWYALCLLVPPALVGAGAIGAALIDGARERRRHRRTTDGLGAVVPFDSLSGLAPRSVATVEGKLVPDPAVDGPTVSFHPYGASYLDEPNVYAVTQATSGAVVLDLGNGARATIEGPVQVVVGSTETEHRASLDRAKELGVPELSAAKVRARFGQFRAVRAGDRVRVRGLVEPAPDDDALYRARARALKISPAPGDTPGIPHAVPVAVVGTVKRLRSTSGRPLFAMLVASVALGGALALALPRPPTLPVHVESPEKGPPAPPPCRAEVTALLEHGSEDAARVAKDCGDPYAMALVHFTAGEHRAASDAFAEATTKDPGITPSLIEAEAHLFAHEHARTDGTVQRMLRVFYPGPSTAEKRDLECIDGLLGATASADGGHGAGPYVPGYHGKSYRTICSLRPFLKFARELDALGGFDGADEWRDFVNGVYRIPAAWDPVSLPRTTAFAPRSRLLARPVGVERRVLDRVGGGAIAGELARLAPFDQPGETVGDTFADLSSFAAELTLFYAFSGFPERAKPYWPILDHIAEVTSTDRSFHLGTHPNDDKRRVEERGILEAVMSMAAAAALYAGDEARAARYAKVGEPHSARAVTQLGAMLRPGAAWEEPIEDGHWPEHSDVFAAARKGDGAEVARVLTAQSSTGRDTLPRVLHLVVRNKDELGSWFRSSRYPGACLACGASSFHGWLSDRREVARLLGETKEIERIDAPLERFTSAVTDPLIAFELDELETFFNRKH
jgi:hypothetical protein